jgi:hypothetical protein
MSYASFRLQFWRNRRRRELQKASSLHRLVLEYIVDRWI